MSGILDFSLPRQKVSVNIIKIFDGPRHARLELLWKDYHKKHASSMDLHVFDNSVLRLPHDKALNEMWRKEKNRPLDHAIFTEFDFLPGAGFLDTCATCTVTAAEYCTRNPETLELESHGIPAPWYVHVMKDWAPPLDFSAGGAWNDPAANIPAAVLGASDCMPRHYGCGVADKGEHLFWSRHYNDPPDVVRAGFKLGPILEKVDKAIEEWPRQSFQ